MEELMSYCQQVMKNYNPPIGWAVTKKEWVVPGDYLTKDQIKVGEQVLRFDGQNWTTGRVLAIDDDGLVSIDERARNSKPIQISKLENLTLRPISALQIP
jgi:hypothetical protein